LTKADVVLGMIEGTMETARKIKAVITGKEDQDNNQEDS